ncbi:hypothetical protein ERJ70_18155 [Sediminibacillus dalangtanensis]|uniref:Permuted papain-like amidase enzyme, YaeF/YiiX, C92 family n=1 Tax=Sediminibacillus dalangtanensis TaxID=2729421 RepID=A0ABX7VVP6_9BACI|nr:hypothetical protein [Sediminibacillus dalangtanensis]QTN01043.1 hypothetical protein ERJ70_18155 [Sediminibacillus dalangtanensis]
MTSYFQVHQESERITIESSLNRSNVGYSVYIDQILYMVQVQGGRFSIDTTLLREGTHQLQIISFELPTGTPVSSAAWNFQIGHRDTRDRDFQPGDILVASDNLDEIKTGYVGHSALVVDKESVIESPGLHPAIRKASIQQFLTKHPVHGHFRPKASEAGKAAAKYAEGYLNEFKEKGQQAPVFSFNLSSSLDDPWEYIYCSKLIWLSYYYGADYKLENDFLWFSPEDLYNNLKENDDFTTVYQHPDVKFILNT